MLGAVVAGLDDMGVGLEAGTAATAAEEDEEAAVVAADDADTTSLARRA